jgi:hypothetical protein
MKAEGAPPSAHQLPVENGRMTDARARSGGHPGQAEDEESRSRRLGDPSQVSRGRVLNAQVCIALRNSRPKGIVTGKREAADIDDPGDTGSRPQLLLDARCKVHRRRSDLSSRNCSRLVYCVTKKKNALSCFEKK